MAKRILYSDEARKALAAGIDKVAEAVKITLGPKGRAVVFNRGVGPIFSLDGVTVAKQIELEDEAEQDGVELVKGVARETDKTAGDGTTTATILVQSILKQGMKALASGIDHTLMKEGMEDALDIARKTIKGLSIAIKDKKDIADVATIASRDREVGDCVAAIVDELGKNAVIAVEEGKTYGLTSEIVEGMKLDKGYVSPYFMTNMERGEAILEKPYVLVTSQVVSVNQDIIKILNEVFNSDHRQLLVIADTIKGEALATLIINKMQGRLGVVAVQAPGLGDDKAEQMKDICAMTGAKFVTEDTGKKLEDATLEDLGRAEKAIITKDSTVIVGGEGRTKARVGQIKSEIKLEQSDYKRELKEHRLAKLMGGVAVIRVGTISEEENAEKRYRVEDAVRAAKSSIEEGVVIGGGMALYEAARIIGIRADKEKNLSYRMGLKIIEEAIKEPARQIIANAGGNPDVILAKAVEMKQGYDSNLGRYVDLVKEGIIDPAKVVRTALENAISICSMFLITGAVVVEAPKKEDKKTNE